MSEVEISWEAPPDTAYRPHRWHAVVEQVKGRPGQWAKVGEWNKGTSPPYNAKKWFEKNVSDPALEIRVARIDAEKTGLWLRWRTPAQMRAVNGD